MSATTLIIDNCNLNDLVNLPNNIEYLFINNFSIDLDKFISCNLPCTLKYLYINAYFIKGITNVLSDKYFRIFGTRSNTNELQFQQHMINYKEQMILSIERNLPHGCKLELNPYFPKMNFRTTPHVNIQMPLYLFDKMNESLSQYKNNDDDYNIFSDYIIIREVSDLNKKD